MTQHGQRHVALGGMILFGAPVEPVSPCYIRNVCRGSGNPAQQADVAGVGMTTRLAKTNDEQYVATTLTCLAAGSGTASAPVKLKQ